MRPDWSACQMAGIRHRETQGGKKHLTHASSLGELDSTRTSRKTFNYHVREQATAGCTNIGVGKNEFPREARAGVPSQRSPSARLRAIQADLNPQFPIAGAEAGTLNRKSPRFRFESGINGRARGEQVDGRDYIGLSGFEKEAQVARGTGVGRQRCFDKGGQTAAGLCTKVLGERGGARAAKLELALAAENNQPEYSAFSFCSRTWMVARYSFTWPTHWMAFQSRRQVGETLDLQLPDQTEA